METPRKSRPRINRSERAPLCPLYLASRDRTDRMSRKNHILHPPPRISSSYCIPALLKDWLGSQEAETIFDTLCCLQELYDPEGPLRGTPEDEDLGLAMTLRDCTCFIRLPPGGIARIDDVQVKLGDLDKKRVGTKWTKWRDSEIDLSYFYRALEPDEVETGRIDCMMTALKLRGLPKPRRKKEFRLKRDREAESKEKQGGEGRSEMEKGSA